MARASWAILVPGALAALYFLALVALRRDELSPGFVTAYALATVWLAAYPLLLRRYATRLLPRFFRDLPGVVKETATLDGLLERYHRTYVRAGIALALPAALVGGAIYLQGLHVVEQGGGIRGASDPFFVLGAALIAYGGVLVGFGLSMTWTTLAAIARVAGSDLALHPFHPDTRSGLKPFGDFALPTTLLVASGALVLPLVFLYAPSLSDPYLLAGVLCHTLAILATFVAPIVMVHRGAERARHAILDRLQQEYDGLRARLHTPGVDSLALDRQLQHVRREQVEARDMKLYPFDTRVFVELTSSVLLPVLVLLVSIALRRLGIGG